MKLCTRCEAPIVGRGNRATRCTLCASHDPHRHAGRRLPQMFVGVDSETRWSPADGRQRILTLTYAREDGSRATWIRGRDGDLETEAYLWLVRELSGPYEDAAGQQWRQVAKGFHLNHDLAVLGNGLDPREMFLVRKVQVKIETALCGREHRMEKDCDLDTAPGVTGILHRYQADDINAIISDGMLGDVIAFHRPSGLALAGAAGQGMYLEERPNGDRYEGWSRLVIRDVGRSFLGGLLQVIAQWNPELSPSDLALIEWGKSVRGDGFGEESLERIAAYSEAECLALARVCRKLQDAVRAGAHVDMRPSQLAGSGSIAAATLRHYKAPRRSETHCDDLVDPLARMTYFGGLIEAPVVGLLAQPVDGADINSAYPSKMIHIPCMRSGHGRWVKRTSGDDLGEHLGHVLVSWDVSRHQTSTPPFMVRRKSGAVAQPLAGSRVWVTLAEYQAARRRFPLDIAFHRAWEWMPECDCGNVLGFLSDLYAARLAVKDSMASMVPGSPAFEEASCVERALKLIINSIYGKLAQSKNGLGPYTNLHYASYVTGATRAQVREEAWEIETAGGTVVYQHTDSVLSVGVNVLDEGKGLGKWGREKTSHNFLVIQPGLALSLDGAGKIASRGVRQADFIPAAHSWFAAADLSLHPREWPALVTEQSVMISRRQALARGKPHLAGSFETKITSSCVIAQKRDYEHAEPVPGNPLAWRVPPILFVWDMATEDDLREFKSRLDRRRQSGEFDLE